jgi:hypothetical protein
MKPATFKIQIGVLLAVVINLMVLVGGIISIGVKWGHVEAIMESQEKRINIQAVKINYIEQAVIAHTGKALGGNK